MKKEAIIILCILTLTISGCRDKVQHKEDPEQPTVTTAPTNTPSNTPTPMAAEPTPKVDQDLVPKVENGEYTFQVQPITTPENFEVPYMSKEDFPRLDGSTANIPLGESIYCYLTGASKEEAKADLLFYKTPESYRRLMNNEVDLLFVYEPSQIILEEMKEANAEFEFKPLGRDALVFIANETNAVSSLTQKQLVDIYTGKIENWSEVGGKDMPILPFQRPATSGSQTLMEKLAVSSDIIMNGPQVVRPEEMGDLIDTLATYNNDSNALGYSVYFYANYMYSKPGLKFMAVDGIMPNNETIQKGTYPYYNDFYVVIRESEPADSNARKIYDWMTTVDAQMILTEAGYVPVVDVNANLNVNQDGYGTKITGSMKLNQNQYMILHNVSPDHAFIGDCLLDSNFQVVKEFPGEYIDDNHNLLCDDDDVLILKCYERVEDDLNIKYKLYSIKKQNYVSDQIFNNIEITDLGYYVCTDYLEEGSYRAIYDSKGNLVKEFELTGYVGNVSMVQDHIVYFDGFHLIFYNNIGKEIKKVELPYENAYISASDYWRGSDTQYVWMLINQEYKIIFDKDGNRIVNKQFLKNYMKEKHMPDLWITGSIVANDGHLYASGMINDTYLLTKDDGTILTKFKNPEDRYYIGLHKNVYSILDSTDYSTQLFTYDGTCLNPNHEEVVQLSESYVILHEEYFDVYASEKDLHYTVQAQNINQESFQQFEGFYYPELINYFSSESEQDYLWHSSFKGIRNWDTIVDLVPVGDYYIVREYDDNDTYYCILDANGEILYQGAKNERIEHVIPGKELYLFVETGNYAGVKDLKGNYLYQQFSDHLGDD